MQRLLLHPTLALALLGGTGAMICATESHAQQVVTDFRLTWITDTNDPAGLGFTPNPDLHGTMGINNNGQIVYGYSPNETIGNVRPFLWLPGTAYGLSAGWHDLYEIAAQNCTFDLPAIARDISIGGVIIGQSDGINAVDPAVTGPCQTGEGFATRWDIDDAESCFQLLGTLEDSGNPPTPPSGAWSGAFAISNDLTPVIVGMSSIMREPGCDSTGTSHRLYSGFRYISGMVELSPEVTQQHADKASSAYDVSNGGSSAWIAGQSRCWDFWSGCTSWVSDSPCDFTICATDIGALGFMQRLRRVRLRRKLFRQLGWKAADGTG